MQERNSCDSILARLNIYYLGGIIITGITAAVLLFSGSNNSAGQKKSINPVAVNKSIQSVILEIPVVQPIEKIPDISGIIAKELI